MIFDHHQAKNLILTLAYGGVSGVLASSYQLANSIPFAPKNTTSVDQSTVYNGTYFLADRVNGGIHVVDLAGEKQTTLVSGFAGLFTANGTNEYDISGPNGLVVLPNRNELYVGDGAGTVRVIDLFQNNITANISIGVSTRADEMAYDSKTGTVVVTLPNEKPPQVAVISAKDRTVLGKVTFQNASGLEQPVFNEVSRKFYVSVPSTDANPGGEITAFDVSNFEITEILPLFECIPAGIVFGADQNLFISCSQSQIDTYGVAFSQVMDVSTGNVVANISGVAGSDQVAYDPNTQMYFAAAYQNQFGGKKDGAPMPQLAVIDANSNTLMQTWATDSKLAHSVAVDPKTNQVVVPLVKSGITVYNLSATNSSSRPPGSSSSTAAVHSANAGSHWAPSVSVVVGVLALAVPFIWV